LLQSTLHVRDHALRSAEGTETAAFFQVFFGFIKARIYDAPLGGGVFVVGVRELGTVNHQPWRDHNLAALKGKIHQVPLGQPGLSPDAGGNGYLAFVLDFGGCVHSDNTQIKFGNPESGFLSVA
jgi:hypothetical protein